MCNAQTRVGRMKKANASHLSSRAESSACDPDSGLPPGQQRSRESRRQRRECPSTPVKMNRHRGNGQKWKTKEHYEEPSLGPFPILPAILCVQHSTAQHSTAQHSTAQHSTAPHRTAQHSTAQHSTAQHSTAQHSTAQYNISVS